MTETVGVVPPRAASVVAAEIDGQLTGGHNAGRSITRKLAIEARDALERAAALRAPTIAALEPLQLTESEAAELDAFRAKPSRAEGLTFTPVPTIAAPSPSNEVTPEMVDAARLEYWRGVLPRDDDGYLLGQMRAALEAAIAVHYGKIE